MNSFSREYWLPRWAEALESQEYQSGKSFLYRETEEGKRWCCLGVLCDIIDRSGWQEAEPGSPETTPLSELVDSWGVRQFQYGGHIEKSVLPEPLAQQMNITTSGHFQFLSLSRSIQERIKELTGMRTTASLTETNDTCKDTAETFPLIARIIRECPQAMSEYPDRPASMQEEP